MQKVRWEEQCRRHQWADLKNSLSKPEYFPDADFEGWLRVSIWDKSMDGSYYFWIDADCQENGAERELSLNWFAVPEKKLHHHYLKYGDIPINRVRVKAVMSGTEISAEGQALGDEIPLLSPFDVTPERMEAALSGRAWYVGLLKTKERHPANMAARYFDIDYFEGRLSSGETRLRKVMTSDGQMQEVEVGDGLGLHVTARAEEYLVDEFLSPMQLKFRQVIEVGVCIPDCAQGFASVPSGCVCCEPEDYQTFWPFFSQVLDEMYKGTPPYKILHAVVRSLPGGVCIQALHGRLCTTRLVVGEL